MVSCGKDNKIYCWNPNTELPEGEILSEVATTQHWYSDVQWCPRNPALIASSSLEGAVSVYSLFGGTQHQVQTSNKIADSFPGMDQMSKAPVPQQTTSITYSDLKKAPKWMRKHSGVSFGVSWFILVTFSGRSLRFFLCWKSLLVSIFLSIRLLHANAIYFFLSTHIAKPWPPYKPSSW